MRLRARVLSRAHPRSWLPCQRTENPFDIDNNNNDNDNYDNDNCDDERITMRLNEKKDAWEIRSFDMAGVQRILERKSIEISGRMGGWLVRAGWPVGRLSENFFLKKNSTASL